MFVVIPISSRGNLYYLAYIRELFNCSRKCIFRVINRIIYRIRRCVTDVTTATHKIAELDTEVYRLAIAIYESLNQTRFLCEHRQY